MSTLLHSWAAPAAVGNLEIRACKAPPNKFRWVFMWSVVETLPDGTTTILDGTGQNGHGGSMTMAEALKTASQAFEGISIRRGG